MPNILVLLLFSISNTLFAQVGGAQASSPTCTPGDVQPQPDDEGFVSLLPDKGASIHWMRIKSKVQPSTGVVFYLAGGPWPAYPFLPMANAFQAAAFPDKDVILYDYLGTNCSSPLMLGPGITESYIHHLTIEGMAKDFFVVKAKLTGSTPIEIMGGSFGAMLGAKIIEMNPKVVKKAVLFSGDLTSDWLAQGWLRFDRILQDISKVRPDFSRDLRLLLNLATRGSLKIKVKGGVKVLSREELESLIWLLAAQNSVEQSQLPDLVSKAIPGDLTWIENVYTNDYLALTSPIPTISTPTAISAVTNFYRCNVFHTKSARLKSLQTGKDGTFLKLKTLAHFWDQICGDYDHLGEYPFEIEPLNPSTVPILSWTGDRDMFDPMGSRLRYMNLSSELHFEVMSGWSHDFGPNPTDGFNTIVEMINKFGM